MHPARFLSPRPIFQNPISFAKSNTRQVYFVRSDSNGYAASRNLKVAALVVGESCGIHVNVSQLSHNLVTSIRSSQYMQVREASGSSSLLTVAVARIWLTARRRSKWPFTTNYAHLRRHPLSPNLVYLIKTSKNLIQRLGLLHYLL